MMARRKIEELTPEQTARFAEFVDKWKRIGLCTDPADRPAAEAAIRDMYRLGGKEPPKTIVWCGSPLSMGLTRAIILDKKMVERIAAAARDAGAKAIVDPGDSVWASVWASVGDSVRDSVWASVWASVRDSVWASVGASVGASVRASVGASVRASVGASVGDSVGASVWDSVRDSVWDSVRASVWDSVRASVRDSVRASVRDSVRASVRDSVWDSVRASVRDSVWDSVRASVRDSVRASVRDSVRDSVSYPNAIYGQHEAGGLAFYDFFRTVNGLVAETNKIAGITAYAQHAGWAVPHSNICWVSERHNILLRDDAGRLHNAAGPACAFPDGWAIYAWHGTRVPMEWIEKPNDLKPETVLKAANLEQRRAGIEMLGWDRMLSQLNARVIDKDPDPQIGTLLAVELPGVDGGASINAQFLRVTCGTGRQFAMAIDPAANAKTALDAQAWFQGIKPEAFRIPQFRT